MGREDRVVRTAVTGGGCVVLVSASAFKFGCGLAVVEVDPWPPATFACLSATPERPMPFKRFGT